MARTNGGFTKTPNDLLEDNTIVAPARLLYIILLKYAWNKNQVFPGQKRLAESMGVDDRTIRTYLKILEEHGLISIQRQGLTKTNLYTLHKWISPTPKRRNNPLKSDDSIPPLNGSQLPTNNTQYKKTKSEERVSTHTHPPTFISDSSQDTTLTPNEIISACTPHLRDISLSTGASVDDIKDVLTKMANHYSETGKTFQNWSAKLSSWVINDIQAGKFDRDYDTVRRAEREKEAEELRQKNIQVVVSIFGEDWREVPGLRDKANEYLRANDYRINKTKFETFLEQLKRTSMK